MTVFRYNESITERLSRNMLSLSARQRLRRFFISPLFLALLAIPAGFLVYTAHNAYSAAKDTHERRMALEEELAEVEARNAMLEANIARLNNPREIEEELRKRYDVGREGEEVVVLVEEEEKPHDTTPTDQQGKSVRPWWHMLHW